MRIPDFDLSDRCARPIESLARAAYETYCADSDWKNSPGNPCPAWLDLPEAIRHHWRASVVHTAALVTSAVAAQIRPVLNEMRSQGTGIDEQYLDTLYHVDDYPRFPR